MNINILVLDETDRMLDLGFINQIQKIINFFAQEQTNSSFYSYHYQISKKNFRKIFK